MSRKPVKSEVQGFSHVCPECGAGLDGRKDWRRDNCVICGVKIDWINEPYPKEEKKKTTVSIRTLG